MDIITIKQISFYVYCLIIPILLTFIGIGITYVKINKLTK